MADTPILSPLLGLKSIRRGRGSVNPFALAAFLLASGFCAGLGVIATFGDPLGGEPRVALAIDPNVAQLRATVSDPAPAALALAQPEPPRPSLKPEPGETRVEPEGVTRPELASAPVREAEVGGPSPADRALLEQTEIGLLPRIADDGRRSSQVYARPFDDADGRPRVGLILSGLGLSQTTTQAAIRELPAEITLSFVPYARNLETWTREAKAAGHEVMLELPMEPFDYPANDPGPYTLLTSNSRAENERRMEWLMSRFTGYFGVINYLGGKFTASNTSLKPVLQALEARGIAYIDDGFSQRTVLKTVQNNVDGEWTVVDRVIDARLAAAQIDSRLLELEALAIQNGSALGKGSAYPVTIDHIKSWVAEVDDRGYALSPASAVLRLRRGVQ
ncbi:MAG: divergent polysaccharide deacetylase family protein [Pseudomonadota bacterium]